MSGEIESCDALLLTLRSKESDVVGRLFDLPDKITIMIYVILRPMSLACNRITIEVRNRHDRCVLSVKLS